MPEAFLLTALRDMCVITLLPALEIAADTGLAPNACSRMIRLKAERPSPQLWGGNAQILQLITHNVQLT